MDLYLIPLEKDDADLPLVEKLLSEPSVSQYFSASEDYFRCITGSENVVFFKIQSDRALLGGIHCEVSHADLRIRICVAESFRRCGIACHALKTLIAELPEGIRRIEAIVDGENQPALRLFEKLCFRRYAWSEGRLTYRLAL